MLSKGYDIAGMLTLLIGTLTAIEDNYKVQLAGVFGGLADMLGGVAVSKTANSLINTPRTGNGKHSNATTWSGPLPSFLQRLPASTAENRSDGFEGEALPVVEQPEPSQRYVVEVRYVSPKDVRTEDPQDIRASVPTHRAPEASRTEQTWTDAAVNHLWHDGVSSRRAIDGG